VINLKHEIVVLSGVLTKETSWGKRKDNIPGPGCKKLEMSEAKCMRTFMPAKWNRSSLIYLLRLGWASRERVDDWFVRHNNDSEEDLRLQFIAQLLVILNSVEEKAWYFKSSPQNLVMPQSFSAQLRLCLVGFTDGGYDTLTCLLAATLPPPRYPFSYRGKLSSVCDH
jgi:hypothetical protein